MILGATHLLSLTSYLFPPLLYHSMLNLPIAVSEPAPAGGDDVTGGALLAMDLDEKARKEEERLARFAGGRF